MPNPIMASSTTFHDLKTLVRSLNPVIAIETADEERVQGLLLGISHELERPLFQWSAVKGLIGRGGELPVHGTTDPLGLMRHLATLTIAALVHLKDFAPYLGDPTLQRAFRETAQHFARTRASMVLTGDPLDLPPPASARAVFMRLEPPSDEELRLVVAGVLASLRERERIRVTIEPDQLETVVRALSGLTLSQARQALAYVMLDDGRLGPDDIPRLLERKARAIQESGLLEYMPLGANHFELGGFARLKAWLERARVGFTAEARALNLAPPKGVLIVGVQGCGKSLAAKAIAREWRLPLLKLDAGRLYDKYVGQSERNFHRASRLAETMSPVVLWIDEIEKGFATGGSEDGGVSRRLLGAFLTWLQERSGQVFLVATANDLSALPPELLRKGRFDEIFFVDLPDDLERRAIFDIHLRLRRQEVSTFDLGALSAAADGFSGAEIEQAVIAGLYRALHAKTPFDTALLLQELADTVPLSVSRREDIARLRALAATRFVPVR